MQYGSKFLLPLLLAIGFLVTCTSEGGDNKGGSGGSSSTSTGGSGTGGRGGSGTGRLQFLWQRRLLRGRQRRLRARHRWQRRATDGGAYAEAGSRPPKLAGQDQFVSPTAGGQPRISLIDGDGNLWWVDLDEHVGF